MGSLACEALKFCNRACVGSAIKHSLKSFFPVATSLSCEVSNSSLRSCISVCKHSLTDNLNHTVMQYKWSVLTVWVEFAGAAVDLLPVPRHLLWWSDVIGPKQELYNSNTCIEYTLPEGVCCNLCCGCVLGRLTQLCMIHTTPMSLWHRSCGNIHAGCRLWSCRRPVLYSVYTCIRTHTA